MVGDRVALFGLQLSMVGGLVLVAEGYQFGIFFPFGWAFILLGLLVTIGSIVME